MVAFQTGPKAGTGVRVLTLGHQKTTIASSQQERGKRYLQEPEPSHDQNVKVRDRKLQVAGRLKCFLCSWKTITSDSKILDMVDQNPS